MHYRTLPTPLYLTTMIILLNKQQFNSLIIIFNTLIINLMIYLIIPAGERNFFALSERELILTLFFFMKAQKKESVFTLIPLK